jgi:hypothetical protein
MTTNGNGTVRTSADLRAELARLDEQYEHELERQAAAEKGIAAEALGQFRGDEGARKRLSGHKASLTTADMSIRILDLARAALEHEIAFAVAVEADAERKRNAAEALPLKLREMGRA